MSTDTIKHVASPLARQTLQDRTLTAPVASLFCIASRNTGLLEERHHL